MPPTLRIALFRVCALITFLAGKLVCLGVEVHNPRLTADGGFAFSFSTGANAYYRVFYGTNLAAVSQFGGAPQAILLGGPDQTVEAVVTNNAGFFRVQEVPVESRMDSDGDGIDDVWELRHPENLNPLNAADASTDPDGDGRSLLQDYELVPQEFAITLGTMVKPGVPGFGAGRIEARGAQDVYHFDGKPGQTVFIRLDGHEEALGEAGWWLSGSSMVFNKQFYEGNPGLLVLQEGGRYTISVGASLPFNTSGTYAFSVLEVPRPQRFQVYIGDSVTNGVPGPGAGMIEVPGASDIYFFDATPGQEVFIGVDNLVETDGRMYWRLQDSSGSVVFENFINPNPGFVVLELGGRYTLTINPKLEQHGRDGAGTYAFSILSPPLPREYSLHIGDSVTNGVPAAGAGVLEVASVRHAYTFTAVANDVVDVRPDGFSEGLATVFWQLRDEAGTVLVNRYFAQGSSGRIALFRGGRYTIMVNTGSWGFRPGTYAFTILPVKQQVFPLVLGDSVTNGVPGGGAGVIEEPGDWDIYTFDAAPGQEVFFRLDGYSPALKWLDWELRDEIGVEVKSSAVGYGSPGRMLLQRGGRYKFRFNASPLSTAVGSYAFSIFPVQTQEFSVAIGNSVKFGVPGPGAGKIETPGARDIYTFEAMPGQTVVVETQAAAPALYDMNWRLLDEGGMVLFENQISRPDLGLAKLERGGRYTLIVNSDDRFVGVGTYSFRIRPVPPPQEFLIKIGDSVTNGIPAAGAGTLNSANSRDAYTFVTTSDRWVGFRFDGWSEELNFASWQFQDDFGTLFGGQFKDREWIWVRLVKGRKYTILVNPEGYNYSYGTYGLSIRPAF